MNPILNKILKHNKLNKLEFISENHKYFVDGTEFISVTSKIGKYFPFNAIEISRKIAFDNWTVEEEVLSEWKALAERGSYIHILCERYFKLEKLNSNELDIIKSAIKFISDHSEFEIIASEIQVFSKKYQVAGSIDLIVRDKRNNRLYTIDFKTTNKEIRKEDIWQMGVKPFENIPKNKYYMYSLQLWTYNLILKEEYGIEIWDSLIVQLKEEDYVKITPCTMIYESEMLLEE